MRTCCESVLNCLENMLLYIKLAKKIYNLYDKIYFAWDEM